MVAGSVTILVVRTIISVVEARQAIGTAPLTSIPPPDQQHCYHRQCDENPNGTCIQR